MDGDLHLQDSVQCLAVHQWRKRDCRKYDHGSFARLATAAYSCWRLDSDQLLLLTQRH